MDEQKMSKIKWCLQKGKGIEIIEPNQNLAEAYIKKAEEAMESMRLIKNRDWKISTAYYSMYFSLYAILMRIGIKSEIHTCTIEFMKRFLSEYFSKEENELVENSFKARIDTQYYVNKEVPNKMCDKMTKSSPEFLVKCKSIALRLDEKKIQEIRSKLKNL